jgi:superfamily II DNA or RNA helicase
MHQLLESEIEVLLSTMSPSERKTYIQEHGFQYWKDAGRRGTIEAATGVGKTRIGIMAISEQLTKDPKSLVYIIVPTETLRDTGWPDEFAAMSLSHLTSQVKIICYSSLPKVKLKRDLDLIIFDEIHHLTELKTALFNPEAEHKVWNILGLTATLPNKKRGEDATAKRDLIDSIAPSIYQVPLKLAVKLELTADFDIKVFEFFLNTTHKCVTSQNKGNPFQTTEAAYYIYLTKMVQRMLMAKKEGAKFAWLGKRRQFLVNLKSKELLAAEVIEKMTRDSSKRTLVFCGGIEQSKKLVGEKIYNSKSDDSQLKAFKAKQINILGVVNALNEGENIEDLDQSLVVQLDSNELNILQRIGRNIRFRPGHKALIVILVAKGTADEKWASSALAGIDSDHIKRYLITVKFPVDASA